MLGDKNTVDTHALVHPSQKLTLDEGECLQEVGISMTALYIQRLSFITSKGKH